MDGAKIPPIELRNVQITFRNFSGKPTRFDTQGGRRNFCILLDDETAKKLEDEQWKVKYLKPREEGDTPQAYMQVKVAYNEWYTPSINVIAGDKMKQLNEDTVDTVDSLDIEFCDMTLNGRWFENADGNKGYSAYLKEIFIHVAISRLAQEYAKKYQEEIEDNYVDCGHVCNGDCSSCPENV